MEMKTTKDKQEVVKTVEEQKKEMLDALKLTIERVEKGEVTNLLLVRVGKPTEADMAAGAPPDAIAAQVFYGCKGDVAPFLLEVLNHHIKNTIIPQIMASADLVAMLIPVGGSPEDASDKVPERPQQH